MFLLSFFLLRVLLYELPINKQYKTNKHNYMEKTADSKLNGKHTVTLHLKEVGCLDNAFFQTHFLRIHS